MYKKIIKCWGHCYDGCGWIDCSYWKYTKNKSSCTLFNVDKFKSESLNICNNVYGKDYQGLP